MKRQIFRVEQKTGKMPDVAWKVVFEREIDFTSEQSCIDSALRTYNHIVGRSFSVTTDSVLESLRFLFTGEQYRITLIVE